MRHLPTVLGKTGFISLEFLLARTSVDDQSVSRGITIGANGSFII